MKIYSNLNFNQPHCLSEKSISTKKIGFILTSLTKEKTTQLRGFDFLKEIGFNIFGKKIPIKITLEKIYNAINEPEVQLEESDKLNDAEKNIVYMIWKIKQISCFTEEPVRFLQKLSFYSKRTDLNENFYFLKIGDDIFWEKAIFTEKFFELFLFKNFNSEIKLKQKIIDLIIKNNFDEIQKQILVFSSKYKIESNFELSTQLNTSFDSVVSTNTSSEILEEIMTENKLEHEHFEDYDFLSDIDEIEEHEDFNTKLKTNSSKLFQNELNATESASMKELELTEFHTLEKSLRILKI
jgi:hypothetical protein